MIPTRLWLLILFSESLSSLESDPIFECTNRFEFQDVLVRVHPELHNCSYVREKYPACKEKLIVAYSDLAPYSFKRDKEANGFLPGLAICLITLLGLLYDTLDWSQKIFTFSVD